MARPVVCPECHRLFDWDIDFKATNFSSITFICPECSTHWDVIAAGVTFRFIRRPKQVDE